MFLKKLLILVFLSGFSTILVAEDRVQQYDYLTYTINVNNTSGVVVQANAVSSNTELSSVTMKVGNTTYDNKPGVLPTANATCAVADPEGGPSWGYQIMASDKSFTCEIKVTSDAIGVDSLQTNTAVIEGADYCKLSCATPGNCHCSTSGTCNDVYLQGTSEADPHTSTYTLTIAKP